ncbi:3-oxoacyl-[acyl-carrier protein] reductase [Terribacillus aidingensis]|uniref:3-oxoacyl-[acyl-carrier protein] reductase n=1 Tax=Terribacillus aidingensis TaxID=586416 RepID=A0A285NLJ2_9BACI|nr:SDR family oxidoreductase [Terribacillus aidingensis]SNZ09783.1 3-oxoacyl-[acyl-carrier protein] reductase [Terribacillus aidingensis]
MRRVIFITGASGAIGSACARQLAGEGHQLLLHYNRNAQAIENLRRDIPESILGTVQADLTREEGINELVRFLAFPIDQLVYAGGMAHYGLFQDMTAEAMDDLLHVHVKAPWRLCQHMLQPMLAQKKGGIVLISSIWGERGASFEAAYSSVKAAQIGFVKALAKETGTSGVRVNAVTPGVIDTEMNSNLTKEEREQLTGEIPMNRFGTAGEVAEAVSYLLSDSASYINGHVLQVNGGW